MNTPNFLDFWTHRLDPMQAEVRLRLRSHEAGVELRGRLMGPRCRFTTTIEIAYPIRPSNTAGEFTAIVPEPSLWQPAKPFCYEGPVERLDASGATEAGWLRLCFRSLKLGPAGLLLNGKPLTLHGRELTQTADEEQLLQLRSQGFNAVLTEAGQPDIGDLAMSLGVLLILREGPGANGLENFHCQLESGRLKLPAVTRQADGSFTLY